MARKPSPTPKTTSAQHYRVRLQRLLDEARFPDASGEASVLVSYDAELPFAPTVGLEICHGTSWSALLTQVTYDLETGWFECTAEHVYLLEDLDTIQDPGLSLFEHERQFYLHLGWQEITRPA